MHKIFNINKKFISVLAVVLLFLILLWQLGNPDALTQGTEGFYLEIAREMTAKNSWLTPYYLNATHWSKPPIHFWLTMPINLLIPGYHLFFSRMMMILVSLFGILIISRWLEKNFKIKKLFTLFCLFGTLGYLKYSRIYMMEMTLMTFNAISMLYLCNYFQKIKNKKQFYFNKDLYLSSLFLACAILVKGPISFVMASLTIGFYFVFGKNKNKFFLKKSALFLLLSLSISSIWFILCYFKYGYYFIDQFFIKQNLGKFHSKSYPASSIIYGLVLYGFPWIFLLPSSLKHYYQKFKARQISQIEFFLISSFLGYYLIWFIPNQKSYHYAIPALPYLLILILISMDKIKTSNRLNNIFNYSFIIFSSLLSILILVGAKISLSDHSLQSQNIIFCSLVCLSTLFLFTKSKTFYSKSIYIFIFNTTIWLIFVPNFYYPLIPNNIAKYLENKNIAAYYRKPYFIKESLGQKVIILHESQIPQQLAKKDSFIILRKAIFDKYHLASKSKIIKSWDLWIRANPPSRILKAITNNNLNILKEKMYLIK